MALEALPAPVRRQRRGSVEVRRCAIGKGVFALRRFAPDMIVGQITGEYITEEGYGSDYCYRLGKQLHLEPVAPFRYLNHSCDPNCEFDWCDVPYVGPDKPSKYVYVATLRDIEPGEQLTIDYNWSASEAIPCRCRAVNCRGWVVAEEELDFVVDS